MIAHSNKKALFLSLNQAFRLIYYILFPNYSKREKSNRDLILADRHGWNHAQSVDVAVWGLAPSKAGIRDNQGCMEIRKAWVRFVADFLLDLFFLDGLWKFWPNSVPIHPKSSFYRFYKNSISQVELVRRGFLLYWRGIFQKNLDPNFFTLLAKRAFNYPFSFSGGESQAFKKPKLFSWEKKRLPGNFPPKKKKKIV